MPTTVAGAGSEVGSAFGRRRRFEFVRTGPERHADGHVLIAAGARRPLQADADRLARLAFMDVVGHVLGAVDLLAADRDDDVAAHGHLLAFGGAGDAPPDAGLFSGRSFLHALHERPALD